LWFNPIQVIQFYASILLGGIRCHLHLDPFLPWYI